MREYVNIDFEPFLQNDEMIEVFDDVINIVIMTK